jgi:hypothetical protein
LQNADSVGGSSFQVFEQRPLSLVQLNLLRDLLDGESSEAFCLTRADQCGPGRRSGPSSTLP